MRQARRQAGSDDPVPPAGTRQRSPLRAEASAADPPESFGPWRVLETLGEGASGRVLLARRADLEDGRRVAIKTLRSPSAGALARFELERQALARLEHPVIARLYDAGQNGAGVPYVVLEHVDGVPIDLYCDRERLPAEARIRLFLEVCAGVQHAHRNLIVHRDLKPDNILVDREGRPRLLDFGIARLLDAEPPASAASTTLAAEATARTPAYASPEQILGRPITTAADVFSLGIVLYELLTGRSPWRLAHPSRHQLERAICEEDPEAASRAARRPAADGSAELAARRDTAPSRLSRRLRGELDAILRKALAREPEDRYASVEALARDLSSHLAHLPIAARPRGVAATAALFLRRHLGAALAAGVLLAAALVFLLVLAERTRVLGAERDKAEQTLDFLVEVFRAGTPGSAGAAMADGGELKARDILGRAAARVENELASHPEAQATLLDAIGEVYYSLGLYQEAARLHQRALDHREKLSGGDELAKAATRFHMAEALAMSGDPAAAEDSYRQALEVRQRLEPKSAAVADNQIGLALALRLQGKMEEAIEARSEVVELTRHAGVAQRLLALGTWSTDLATQTRWEDAAKANDEAWALAQAAPDVLSVELADGLFEVAVAMQRDSDPRWMPLVERVLVIQRALLAPDHPRLLEAEHMAAVAMIDQARWGEAWELLDRVVEAKKRRLGPEHPLLISAELDRALCIGELGDWDEAVRIGEDVLARARASGKGLGDLIKIHNGLHFLCRWAGDYPAAWPHLLRAQKLTLELGRERAATAQLMLYQAGLEADLGRLEVARGRFELLVGEMRGRFPNGNWRLAWAEGEYARLLAKLGRLDEASVLARRSYDEQSAHFGPRSRQMRWPLWALREIHRQRRNDAGVRAIEELLAEPALRPERWTMEAP